MPTTTHVRELLRDARVRVARSRTLRTQAAARLALFDFIEGWYNPQRRHSALDYLSPMIYERSRGTRDRTEPSGSTIDTGGAISVPPSERVP